MPVTPIQLVDCLEEYMFRTPPGEAGITPLAIPGLRGRATPISTPFTNLVGVAEAGVEIADASIDQAIDEFRGRNQMFGWLIGPRTPPDLPARLVAKGFTPVEEFAGLALTDINSVDTAKNGITIREAGPEDEPQFAALLSAAFGLPPEMVEFLCRIVYFAKTEPRTRNYFAYRPGVDEPIGVGSTVDDPNTPIIILGGSAVLEAHRGNGAYKALVARRLADAREEGNEAVVIQAVRATSAPICSNLGFTEVCAQSLYAWAAP